LSETPVWDDIRLKSAAIWGMPVNRVRNGSFRQAGEQVPAGRRELPMAGLAFEDAATRV
jgi:hypothetical protein